MNKKGGQGVIIFCDTAIIFYHSHPYKQHREEEDRRYIYYNKYYLVFGASFRSIEALGKVFELIYSINLFVFCPYILQFPWPKLVSEIIIYLTTPFLYLFVEEFSY